MPAFLQRLRRPFRRQSQPSVQPETLALYLREKQEEQKQQRSRKEYFEDVRHHKNTPRYELPVVFDKGSYNPSRYPDSDLYWNSVMLETSLDDDNRLKSESGREYARNRRFQNGTASRNRRRPSQNEETRASLHDLKITEKLSQMDGSGDLEQGKYEDSDEDITRWLTPKPAPLFGYPNLSKPLPRQPRPAKPLSPGSRDWDEFMGFPTEHSSGSYNSKNADNRDKGQPHASAAPDQELFRASSPVPHTRPDIAIPKDAANKAMDQAIMNDQVDPAKKETLILETEQSPIVNADGADTSLATTAANLAPNFSYPIAKTTSYCRQIDERVQIQNLSDGETDPYPSPIIDIEKKETRPLPNGVTGDRSSSMYSEDSLYRPPTPILRSRKRTRDVPSNFPTTSGAEVHDNAIDTSPSPKISTEDQSTLLINEETTIRDLHEAISTLQNHIASLEDTLIPKLTTRIERRNATIRDLKLATHEFQDEVVVLRIAIDFSNKILGGCWVREWEVWRTLAQIVEKRRIRSNGLLYKLFASPQSSRYRDLEKGDMPEGYEWQMFSNGPDPTGSEKVVAHMRGERHHGNSDGLKPMDSKKGLLTSTEIDALHLMATQNLRILREDVEETLRLVRGCKGALSSGWQDIGLAEEWREV